MFGLPMLQYVGKVQDQVPASMRSLQYQRESVVEIQALDGTILLHNHDGDLQLLLGVCPLQGA